MNNVKFLKRCVFLLCLSVICCMMSCSSDDSDPEVYEPTAWEKTAYHYFEERGYGSEGYETFDGFTQYELSNLMYGTWNRDTMVMENGERKLLAKQSVEITKDCYIVKNGKNTTRLAIKGDAKIANGKLIFELETGGVVQYESMKWSLDQCTVMVTDQDGNTFCDNRKVWANTMMVYWWCTLKCPYIP